MLGSGGLWAGRVQPVGREEAMTDADGKFTVPVHFEIDSDRRESPLWYYTYNIQADVTDGAGGTQQANLSLPLGSTSMVLNMDICDNWVKEKKLEIKTDSHESFG